ncbi:hypothetical protein [Streptomyces sp. AP-93]|uniref:hypothetical protein n=1 Tax=Streptomyces sp. AP-93 TaxID=2929048 RepID=UPI001FAFEC13|nr:hypothetical protein [Streptomyces sp. AP-93]MCJ0869591.1 hypothetical protein [Streptomyces sp. AP-93]
MFSNTPVGWGQSSYQVPQDLAPSTKQALLQDSAGNSALSDLFSLQWHRGRQRRSALGFNAGCPHRFQTGCTSSMRLYREVSAIGRAASC